MDFVLGVWQREIWNRVIQPHMGEFQNDDEERHCHMRWLLWSCSKLSFLFSITLLMFHWQLFPVQQFPFTHFTPQFTSNITESFWFWPVILPLIKVTTSDNYTNGLDSLPFGKGNTLSTRNILTAQCHNILCQTNTSRTSAIPCPSLYKIKYNFRVR